MKKLILLIIAAQSFIITNAQWQYNNGPYGGFVRCLAVDGSNIFAGTKNNGVFLSTDYGNNWSSRSVGIPQGIWINTIVIKGLKIYAGTDAGVFLSENYGSTWTYISYKLPNYFVRSLAVIGNSIFAGTQWTGGGLFLSNDAGATWAEVDSGIGNRNIDALAACGTNLFVGGLTGLFMSSNYGKSWKKVHDRIVTAFAVEGNTIWAVGENISVSTDNGSNWKVLTGVYVGGNTMAINGSKIVLAGLNGVNLSTDNGKTWKEVNSGLTDLFIHAVAIIGSNIFAGSEHEGVFLSKDNGNSWNRINNGLGGIGVYSFAVKGATLYAGTSNKLFSSNVNGNIWKEELTGAPQGAFFSSFAIEGENIFAGSYNSGIYLSTNNGGNWNKVNNGLMNSMITSLAINGNYIFAGTGYGIYLSTDNGKSWSARNNGIRYPVGGIRCLLKHGNTIYVGTDGRGLYSSNDNGTNWIRDTVLPDNNSSQIMSLASIGENIYVDIWYYGLHRSADNGRTWNKMMGLDSGQVNHLIGRDGLIIVGNSHGISFSNNSGSSWTKMNQGLKDTNIISIGMSETYLFAGTNGGVWKRPINEMASVKNKSTYNRSTVIYPNPSNGKIRISNSETIDSIVIYNLFGETVFCTTNFKERPSNEIDLTHIGNGIFFVKICSGEKIRTEKILLK